MKEQDFFKDILDNFNTAGYGQWLTALKEESQLKMKPTPKPNKVVSNVETTVKKIDLKNGMIRTIITKKSPGFYQETITEGIKSSIPSRLSVLTSQKNKQIKDYNVLRKSILEMSGKRDRLSKVIDELNKEIENEKKIWD